MEQSENNHNSNSSPKSLGNPESNDFEPSLKTPQKERVIQPSDNIVKEIESQNHKVDNPNSVPVSNNINAKTSSSIYPEATKDISNEHRNLNASQQYALAQTARTAEENDRPVSIRVKALLVIATLTALSAIYSLVASFATTDSSSMSTILAILSFVQLGMSIYLFVGKDHNTVALIIKIYLAFQLVSLFLSLANPIALIINGAMTIFLFYVYSRVKSLSY